MVGSIEKQGVLLITVLCHHFQYLTNPVGHGSNILQVVVPRRDEQLVCRQYMVAVEALPDRNLVRFSSHMWSSIT